MNESACANGIQPQYNEQIDMHFALVDCSALLEMKSCHTGNIHHQIRRGISQLLEYQFVYRGILGNEVIRILVTEIMPIGAQAWLIDYLQSLGILLVWKDPEARRLITTMPIPDPLSGVIYPA